MWAVLPYSNWLYDYLNVYLNYSMMGVCCRSGQYRKKVKTVRVSQSLIMHSEPQKWYNSHTPLVCVVHTAIGRTNRCFINERIDSSMDRGETRPCRRSGIILPWCKKTKAQLFSFTPYAAPHASTIPQDTKVDPESGDRGGRSQSVQIQ